MHGYNVDVGIVDVFAKNSEGKRVHKQLEIDFVVNQGSQRYYIQVAYDMTSEEKQTQELNSFRNIFCLMRIVWSFRKDKKATNCSSI